MLASVGTFISSWIYAPVEPSLTSPANSPAVEQQQQQRQQLTPLHPTMRDPSASTSSLKRAAPVESGLMPEQFYTLNPDFLTDTEKWSYKDLQRLAKQLGVPGGGKGSRKQLEERLADFNRENEQALGTYYAHLMLRTPYAWLSRSFLPTSRPRNVCLLTERFVGCDETTEEDPERWPQQASNFNLVPVNITDKHAAATQPSAAGLGGALAARQANASGVSFVGVSVSAAPAGSPAAGLSVDVPSALRSNTNALISPLVAPSSKRKHAGGGRPGSALRKKSKYSPGGDGNAEYVSRIETTRGPEYGPPLLNGPASGSPSPGATMAAAAAHRASPAINFSPFNRVNLIPAKEEYDEYKADFDPEVKTLF